MLSALVVDDSKVARMILSRTLVESGFEVSQACNGREALETMKLEGEKFQIVLVDWNMPELNGLEFVRRVRAQPQFAGVRLVMVTTETETDQMMRALEAGADEYVMKPFTSEALQDKLRILGVIQ